MTSQALQLLLGPDRRVIAAPEARAIGETLKAAAQDPKHWVTLSWGDHHYVTATFSSSQGFEIQLRDNSPTEQWRIVESPLPLDEVLRIFAAFALKHPDWAESFGYHLERVPPLDVDDSRSPYLPE